MGILKQGREGWQRWLLCVVAMLAAALTGSLALAQGRDDRRAIAVDAIGHLGARGVVEVALHALVEGLDEFLGLDLHHHLHAQPLGALGGQRRLAGAGLLDRKSVV